MQDGQIEALAEEGEVNGSESALWDRVRSELGRYGYVGRVENGVEPGWPDVAFSLRVPARRAVSGWLELKHADKWPTRPATPIVLPHLTLEQVLWLEGWTRAGGRAFLLLQVGTWYGLLTPGSARALYARQLTARDTRGEAVVSGHVFPTRALVEWLTRTS